MKKNIILTLATATVLTLTLTNSIHTDAKVNPVSLNTAAKKYVTTANSSANKKSGKTKVTIVVKGKVTEAKFRKAVSNIRCKNVRKGTASAFQDEILCPVWSDFSCYQSKKNTTVKVTFNNKQMNQFSSYGKTNWIERAEEKVDKELEVFKKAFGEDVMNQKSQLGAFAVSYAHAHENSGNGGTYRQGYANACAKGVCDKTLGVSCNGDATAAVRVMRILGFTKENSGIVHNPATDHAWNWWKDEDGNLYMGDATTGAGFDGENFDNGYGNFLDDEFWFPFNVQLEYFGCKDQDELNEKYPRVYDTCITFETYNKYCPVKGFGNCTKQAWVNSVKSGDDFYASDGESGVDWKLTIVDFNQFQNWY